MIQENKTKLSAEELQELKQIYGIYQKQVFELGLMDYDIELLNQQLETLIQNKKELLLDLKATVSKQQELNNNLGEKYGDKQVDLETGYLN